MSAKSNPCFDEEFLIPTYKGRYAVGTIVQGIGYRELFMPVGKFDGEFCGKVLMAFPIEGASWANTTTLYQCQTDNDGVWWALEDDIRKHRPDQMEPGWEPKESR